MAAASDVYSSLADIQFLVLFFSFSFFLRVGVNIRLCGATDEMARAIAFPPTLFTEPSLDRVVVSD